MKNSDPQLQKAVAISTNTTNKSMIVPPDFAPPSLTALATPTDPTLRSKHAFMNKAMSKYTMVMEQSAIHDVALKVFDEHGYLFRVSMSRPGKNKPIYHVYVAQIPVNSRDQFTRYIPHDYNRAHLSTTHLAHIDDVDKVINATLAVLRLVAER